MASSSRPGGHSSSAIASRSRSSLAWAVGVQARRLALRFALRSLQSCAEHHSGRGNGSLRARGVYISGGVWVGGLELISLGGRERGRSSATSALSADSGGIPVELPFFSATSARLRSLSHARRRSAAASLGCAASMSAIASTSASPVTPAAIRWRTAVAMTLMRLEPWTWQVDNAERASPNCGRAVEAQSWKIFAKGRSVRGRTRKLRARSWFQGRLIRRQL